MPDISQITLPSGTTYDIKDATARGAIQAGVSFTVCTNAANTPYGVQWESGGITITGTLAASHDTQASFYLVPVTTQSGDDIFAEYITVEQSGNYSWEKLGTTDIDLSNLGSLAYQNSASGSCTPNGSVSSSFTGSSGSVSVTGTPSGTVTAPTISVGTAGATDTAATAVTTAAPADTAPDNAITYYAVSGETLILYKIGYTTSSFKTGDATYTASQPSFSGSSTTSTGSFTPTGSVSSTFTGSATSVTVS